MRRHLAPSAPAAVIKYVPDSNFLESALLLGMQNRFLTPEARIRHYKFKEDSTKCHNIYAIHH